MPGVSGCLLEGAESMKALTRFRDLVPRYDERLSNDGHHAINEACALFRLLSRRTSASVGPGSHLVEGFGPQCEEPVRQ